MGEGGRGFAECREPRAQPCPAPHGPQEIRDIRQHLPFTRPCRLGLSPWLSCSAVCGTGLICPVTFPGTEARLTSLGVSHLPLYNPDPARTGG